MVDTPCACFVTGAAQFDTSEAPATWTLAVAIPKEAFGLSAGDDMSACGLKFNSYKCGDSLPTPHWVTLFPIDTTTPDFHRPDGFQPMTFA
eukprot:m.101417 g.101417  ORF g.101417 m.101417 type:complete len:91 (-) comp16806_c0_seq5:2422-2694(-)